MNRDSATQYHGRRIEYEYALICDGTSLYVGANRSVGFGMSIVLKNALLAGEPCRRAAYGHDVKAVQMRTAATINRDSNIRRHDRTSRQGSMSDERYQLGHGKETYVLEIKSSSQ